MHVKNEMYNVLTELVRMGMLDTKLLHQISEVIELNYHEKVLKGVSEKLDIVEFMQPDMQLSAINKLFGLEKITSNAFFRDMEPTLIKDLLQGFDIINLPAGEIIYNMNQPSNAGSHYSHSVLSTQR